jgi:serine/threonine-protein kinase
MTLAIGTQLGSHEITALLGKGGMGEVYRARDLKLKREVAIKILPEEFSRDAERIGRFQREAEVLASLSHPNIAGIHDLQEANGSRYLVLELVEGETLADRLKRGPIPFDEAIAVAKQIVDALEAAHERGIVHRDLKPGNIKRTPEGAVKVLDFGLAKATQGRFASAQGFSNSPTLVSGSMGGMILGTAAYMSPEQARGKEVDARTDIFAFGAVLYEMLTGQQAFAGEDVTDTLSRVLQREPDWTLLPANTRPRIRELLKLCLQKDARKRRQTAVDVRIDMEQAMSEPTMQATPVAAPQKRSIAPWAAAAVLAVVALALGIALWKPWHIEPLKPLVRLEVDLGADVALPGNPGEDPVVLSPDGTRLAYIASVAGAPRRLYVRRLDLAKATELQGTEGAQNPLFSPDGQSIGFFVGSRLNTISVEGGAVVPLTDVDVFMGVPESAAWGVDGRILLGGILKSGLRLLPALGGQAAKLTDLGSGEVAHAQAQFLPGGKFALFNVVHGVGPGVDVNTIEAVSLSDGKRKVVGRGGFYPHYLPSGHLVYVNKSTLFAIPFDPAKLEISGNPIPILDDVKFNQAPVGFSFSSNGTLVYMKGGGAVSGQSIMQWTDPAGKRSPLMTQAGVYGLARLSPDAKRLAVEVTEDGGAGNVWVYDVQRDTPTKLTFSGSSVNPIWTPDGRFIIFQKPGAGVFWIPADGAGQPQPLIEDKFIVVPWSMSPNGKRLAFFEPGKGISTSEVSEDGGVLKAGKPERFFESTFNAVTPEFSPDGHWIAYATGANRVDVEVRAFPAPASGQGGKWLVSSNGGRIPRWSRNSHELLYQEGDRIMAVSYTVNGGSFKADKPHVRLEKLGGGFWDLAPDGRIAVVMPVESSKAPAADHTVVFLENFFDYLRQRVPVGR